MRYDIGVSIDYESDAEDDEIAEDLQKMISAWPGTRRVFVTVHVEPEPF